MGVSIAEGHNNSHVMLGIAVFRLEGATRAQKRSKLRLNNVQ